MHDIFLVYGMFSFYISIIIFIGTICKLLVDYIMKGGRKNERRHNR